MKMRPVFIELLHAYRRTGRLNEIDRRCARLQTLLKLAEGKIKDTTFNGDSFITPLWFSRLPCFLFLMAGS
jgi:hypothetical protein